MPVAAAARLVPVIEFDPFEYRVDRPSPGATLETAPDEWARFWRASLADAGISGLEPLPNTWVVPVIAVRAPELLAKLIAAHLDAADAPEFLATLPGPFDPKSGMNADGEPIEEHFTALRGGVALLGDGGVALSRDGGVALSRDGGVALSRDGGVAIAPECCGDLGNWRDWRNAALVEPGSWRELWIGHPSARVRRDDADVLLVQKLAEDGTELGAAVALPIADLRAAADAAVADLMDLDARLLAVLRSQGIDDQLAARMARRLAGLTEFELD